MIPLKGGVWNSLKDGLVSLVGVDRHAAHVLVSVATLLLIAAISGRPLRSWIPWLAVFAIAVANEAVSAYADRLFEKWELFESVSDVALVMALPTTFLLLSRHAPYFLIGRSANGHKMGLQDVSLRPVALPAVIDAEFEEVP